MPFGILQMFSGKLSGLMLYYKMQNTMTYQRRVIKSIVRGASAPGRLDEYLATRFNYRDLAGWQERIAAGEILVNGGTALPSTLLNQNDEIEYRPSDIPEPAADCNYTVAYEDDWLLIVNKPGNLAVHPAGPFFKHTLWYLLTQKYGAIHLVNRLDRETSGLLLTAKDAVTAGKLAKTEIYKEYLVLVHGDFKEPVDAKGFLVKDQESVVRKKRKFVYDPGDVDKESACTRIFAVKSDGELSLVRAVAVTGRLHQIRATMHSLGFPVAGDKLYGLDDTMYLKIKDEHLTTEDHAKLMLPHQALHAAKLMFPHPATGECLEVIAPPPGNWRLQP